MNGTVKPLIVRTVSALFVLAVLCCSRSAVAESGPPVVSSASETDFHQPHSKRIVVGGDYAYPPFEYLDATGEPMGFNVDLTRAIAAVMGLDVEFRLGPWAEVVQGLNDGTIDLIQGMFYTQERDWSYDFTPPHMVAHYIGVVRKGEGPPPESLDDLRGREILLERGDVVSHLLTEAGLGENVLQLETQEEVLRALLDGRGDCAFVARRSTLYLMEQNGWTDLELGGEPLLSLDYCYAALNGRKALLAQFGEGLTVLDADGTYRRLQEKWFGMEAEKGVSLATILRISAWILLPLLAALFLIGIWLWSLRRQVSRKTRELQESAEKFRQVFESANVGKSVTIPGVEIYVNQAMADFLGYSVEEMKGKSWQELTHPEDMELTGREGDRLLSGEASSIRIEKRYLRKDGSTVWGDLSSTLGRSADGKMDYFISTVVNIHEKKLAEEALCSSEEFQSAMIACSPVALFTIDPEGRVQSWNRSAERVFGWSEQEVLGRPLPTVTADKQEEFAKLRALLLAGDSFSGKELVRKHKDGRMIPIRLSVAPVLGDDGTLTAIMSAAEDISEQKRVEEEKESLQEQLMQSQKMEAIGCLAGGVAHDFNNLLTTIIGNVSLSMVELAKQDPVHNRLNEIDAAAQRAAALTRQLLAFSRKQIIEPRVLELDSVLPNTEGMLNRLLGEHIEVVWVLESSGWTVMADPGQIEQVVVNLCVNSRDAMPDGGRLVVKTAGVVLDEGFAREHATMLSGEFVLLTITDNGVGMDDETRARVFEPFFTTKSKDRGTGLGLATCFGIVQQHGGHIEVESEVGCGTTVRVYLPRVAEPVPIEEPEPVASALPGGTETVLVVEDEETVRELVCVVLGGLGYNVLEADCADTALEFSRNHPGRIELLFSDVVMPGMNGRDLAVRMMESMPGIKVLLTSGYTENTIAHRGILDEGINFIGKPYSPHELAVRVRHLLDS